MRKFWLLAVLLIIGITASPVFATQTVVVAPTSANQLYQTESGIVWLDHLTGYAFYVIASDAGLYYKTTNNGGSTWGTGVKIQTSADAANRISNYNVWYDRWTPGDSGQKIHIAWLDAVLDQLHYVNIDTTVPSFGTEVNVTSLVAFTINVAHNSQGVSITKAIGGNLYIASRSSTSLANGQRFMRSTDGGVNWTTRTISHTPASQQTVKGLLFPGNEQDGLGGFLNTNDIFGFDLPSGETTQEVWFYDDSANTWAIIHTITTANVITASGVCPCALATNRTNGRAWVGVRDNTTTSSATFYVAEIQSPTTVVNRTNVYTAQTAREEGVALYYDQTGTVQLLATNGIIVGGETRPTVASSTDQGVVWSAEQSIDVTDSMANPHTAPTGLAGGDRWSPIFTSLSGGQNSLETESEMNIDNVPVYGDDPVTSTPDDSTVDGLHSFLSLIGLGGESGELVFSFATFILLAIILTFVKAPGFIAFPVLALWGGGLTVAGLLPPWIIYVAVLVAGVGIIMLFTKSSTEGEA